MTKHSTSALRAYDVTFTDNPSGPGRHHRSNYKSAVIISLTVADASRTADEYCKRKWPTMHVEEIRLENNHVIIDESLIRLLVR
jgi:hypothetical protein